MTYGRIQEEMPRHQFFVSWEEAERIKPRLQAIIDGEFFSKRIKRVASNLLEELRGVRKDVDYSPLKGKQILLTDAQAHLFEELRTSSSFLGKATAVVVPAALAGLAAYYLRR